jgi:regulator of replication initiation timing
MEYAVSVFSNMMGSPMDSQETYRGMLALEEAGMRKIKHKVQHANHSLRRLGRVLMHYAQALYTMPKVMRIAGETNEDYKEIYLNQIGQDPITGRMKKFNDIGIGQYDIVVYDGTSMPTNRMALLNLYMELYQMGIIDKAEVLKKTDIPNRKAVMERMGEVQQLGAQVNSLGEQIKDIDGLNTTLRRQNQQLQIKIASMEGSMAIKDEVRQTQSQQRLMQARMADRLQILDKEAKLAVREVRVSGAEAGISLKHAELLAKKKSLQPSG